MSNFDDLMDDVKRDDRPNNFIGFVMDHSGSMSGVRDASRDNFNEKIAQIKRDSADMNNIVTIVEFDDRIFVPYENDDIYSIENLDDYWTVGTTSLYDAINKTISIIEQSMPKDGNNAALVTIITDGQENASKEFGGEQGRIKTKARIEELQETGKWTFVFMGADQNVLDTAVCGLGMHAVNTMSYSGDDIGTREAGRTYRMSQQRFSQARRAGQTATSKFFDDGGESQNDNSSEQQG